MNYRSFRKFRELKTMLLLYDKQITLCLHTSLIPGTSARSDNSIQLLKRRSQSHFLCLFHEQIHELFSFVGNPIVENGVLEGLFERSNLAAR